MFFVISYRHERWHSESDCRLIALATEKSLVDWLVSRIVDDEYRGAHDEDTQPTRYANIIADSWEGLQRYFNDTCLYPEFGEDSIEYAGDNDTFLTLIKSAVADGLDQQSEHKSRRYQQKLEDQRREQERLRQLARERAEKEKWERERPAREAKAKADNEEKEKKERALLAELKKRYEGT